MIYPPEGFSQSNTFLAIGYKAASTLANYSLVLDPTIKVSTPLAAAFTPPETGASINSTPVPSLASNNSKAAAGPIVEQSIT